jgi:hypothetical protein
LFEVEALAPLEITLPKLGYTLRYDLLEFVQIFDSTVMTLVFHAKGYNHFQPIEGMSRIRKGLVEKERKEAYYFSPMHFTRAFYENKLAENGYRILEWKDIPLLLSEATPFVIDSCDCISYGDGEAHIRGLNNRKFTLEYYGSQKGPENLKVVKRLRNSVSSNLYFFDDVVIREDGTRSGGSLVFSGAIANKRIGASLPSDYKPLEKSKKEKSRGFGRRHKERLEKGRL